MFEELIIWGPQVADEHGTLAELSEKDRAFLAKELEGLDNKWGITLNRTSYVNSYQNDDNTPLDEKLFTQVWERACDMIFSFEYAFRACWNTDERTTLEKLREGLYIVEKAAPKSKAEVPFFMCYMDDAKKELEDYERQWPEILAKLSEYGMYFKM